jgi:hypothetical protein
MPAAWRSTPGTLSAAEGGAGPTAASTASWYPHGVAQVSSAVGSVAGAHAQLHMQQASPASAASPAAAASRSLYPSSAAALADGVRLKAERRALLASGSGYTAGHPLVRSIDRALHQAEQAARAMAATGAVEGSARR